MRGAARPHRWPDSAQPHPPIVPASAGFALPALVALDMTGNALRELPATLGADLPALRRLHLSCNRLQGLPATLGQVGLRKRESGA